MRPADLNGDDFHGLCIRGEIEKLRLLLVENPDSIINIKKKDEDERTPLHWAAANGFFEILELFVETIQKTKQITRSELVKLINSQDDAGWTPLMSSVSAGHVDCVGLLLSLGANANIANDNGQIALHYHKGREEIFEMILEQTQDLNTQDKYGSTALTRCLGAKPFAEILNLLLKAGASLKTRDLEGNTPLHLAIIEGHQDLALLLVKSGSNLNAKNKAKKSCLDLAPPKLRSELA